jgi:hypothetical protein
MGISLGTWLYSLVWIQALKSGKASGVRGESYGHAKMRQARKITFSASKTIIDRHLGITLLLRRKLNECVVRVGTCLKPKLEKMETRLN